MMFLYFLLQNNEWLLAVLQAIVLPASAVSTDGTKKPLENTRTKHYRESNWICFKYKLDKVVELFNEWLLAGTKQLSIPGSISGSSSSRSSTSNCPPQRRDQKGGKVTGSAGTT